MSQKLQHFQQGEGFVAFRNKNDKQYLKMIHLPGSDPNTFRFFEIGYTENWRMPIKPYGSVIDKFETESGIRLGMSLCEFLQKHKTHSFKKGDNNTIIYSVNQLVDGLKYIGEYSFRKKKLVKFGFGFENP
jgi:hypothetical protein